MRILNSLFLRCNEEILRYFICWEIRGVELFVVLDFNLLVLHFTMFREYFGFIRLTK